MSHLVQMMNVLIHLNTAGIIKWADAFRLLTTDFMATWLCFILIGDTNKYHILLLIKQELC